MQNRYINNQSIRRMSRVGIFVFITLIFSVFTAEVLINAPNSNLPITSQKQLSQFLLAHLGLNSASTSQEIKKYIEANKISILNAVEQIALVFVDSDQQEANNQFEINTQFVSHMGENLNKLTPHFLVDQSPEEVNNYIEKNLNGKKYQQINVKKEQLSKLQRMFTEQPLKITHRVLSQTKSVSQTPGTSFSYITKFFFIILFILVTFGVLATISSMDNRKDTLLYAKFLTDVSGR